MKQGMGHNSDSGRKIEPRPKAVNPAAVSELGIHQYRTKSIQMYEGRGFEAPMNKNSTHKCGSQGRH